MNAAKLLAACEKAGIDFFTGVPDSQLKGLCDTLYMTYGVHGEKHIVAANEGNAVGLAAGYYLATGRPALVYMQNSGLGNAVNPLASLMDGQVYGIPCLMVIGWRGEPGVKDEPQHVTQGQITLGQLELLGIPYMILDKETTDEAFDAAFADLCRVMAEGGCAAIVVRKGALKAEGKAAYGNDRSLSREHAAEVMLAHMGESDIVVSTTGKLSREIFEIREKQGMDHSRDFLTVGSMGHASSIALGIALRKPGRRVWCLDGDGAALMHLGAMAVNGQKKPSNLVHVVIDNGAHETVGGMPVGESAVDFAALAKAAGYEYILHADSEETLADAMAQLGSLTCLCFLKIDCALGARDDLGRPTTTPKENKAAFMAFVGRDDR
ncbi:MAG: phosphonopyruvate decarboxylase [Clostridia bacterium]|nr:phosphonopyruvate decarboxylase [Clostridia bacterium]